MKRILLMGLLALALGGCVADAKGPLEPPQVLDNIAAARQMVYLGCTGKLGLIGDRESGWSAENRLKLDACTKNQVGQILDSAIGQADDDYEFGMFFWREARDFARANSSEVRAVDSLEQFPWALELSRRKSS